MRMGVPNREWRLDDINQNFELCETYPPTLYVPSSTSRAMLLASAKFRSRGRLPVLTYLHHNGVRPLLFFLPFPRSPLSSGLDYALCSAVSRSEHALSRRRTVAAMHSENEFQFDVHVHHRYSSSSKERGERLMKSSP